jgi:hypothetical protein
MARAGAQAIPVADTDAHRVNQRMKQLDLAKSSLAYAALVEQEARRIGGSSPSRHQLTTAARLTSERFGEPDPRTKRSKRMWDGAVRVWRAQLHRAAPDSGRSAGYRPLKDVLATRLESDLLLVAETAGLDLSVRSVWPQPAATPSGSRLAPRHDHASMHPARQRPVTPSRWTTPGAVWVPPPLAGAATDPGAELHHRIVGGTNKSEAAAFASRLDWAAAEEAWTPGFGPPVPEL